MSDTGSTPRRPWTPPPEPKGPAAQVNDLKDMVVAYTKQETVDPLRTLGRHLGFGIGGALLIGTGWIFGLLGLLRLLQTVRFLNDPAQAAGGRFVWVPYLAVVLVGIGVAALYGRMVMVRMNENGASR